MGLCTVFQPFVRGPLLLGPSPQTGRLLHPSEGYMFGSRPWVKGALRLRSPSHPYSLTASILESCLQIYNHRTEAPRWQTRHIKKKTELRQKQCDRVK